MKLKKSVSTLLLKVPVKTAVQADTVPTTSQDRLKGTRKPQDNQLGEPSEV